MHSVVDLELWSEPESAHVVPEGETVAGECRAALSLPKTVVLGLSFIPDATDVECLKLALLEREVTEARFLAYCRRCKLPPNAQNEQSAARFLAFTYGQPLAWLHFPFTAEGLAMYRAVAAWAHQHRLVVVEPSEVCCPIGEASASHYWAGAA